MSASPPQPMRAAKRSPAKSRSKAATSSRPSAALIAEQATLPSRPSAPATPTRTELYSLERSVFEHDHLLSDVREVDGQQSVGAGSGDVDDEPLAPFGMPHAIARGEAEAHARAGVFVNRNFPPTAAARTRPDADAADRFDRGHLIDEPRFRVRER